MFGEIVIEFISFTIFMVMFFVLVVSNFTLRYKNKKTKAESVQMYVNLKMLIEDLQNKLSEKEDGPLVQSEGFIKFISDSRDMAFGYIEEVQSVLNDFINDIEPEIAYFDEYGSVGEGWPHYYSMKKISQAYNNLKELLPADYGKIDK